MRPRADSRRTWTAISLGLVASMGTAASASEPHRAPAVTFVDVTRAAGIEFVQTIGDGVMSNIVESTGVGCGFLDYDGDGWCDIYLVNGCWLSGLSNPQLDPPRRRKLASATDRLYRNRGDGTFADVTVAAGLARSSYGMGIVAADYDGDGDCDIYVTNYGPNCLFRNNGDGTFTEVARKAGVDDDGFSVGAVFLDYDRDGRLDLYVGNYLTYRPDPERGHTADGVRSPLVYEGQPDRLYRQNRDGTFTDVTRTAGVNIRPPGRAMGVGTLDYDNDGWVDIFVSNDAMENFLLHNKGDGTFENVALMAGVAFGETGEATAAMAVEVADYDADGLFDVFVPDMTRCSLYRNLGRGLFADVAVRCGISPALAGAHSWGAVAADVDLDGHLDLYVANGSAWRLEAHRDRLFLNGPRGRFRDVSHAIGRQGTPKRVGRGAAGGDFDNDGDIDLLITNLNDRPILLRNDSPRRGRHWLEVKLVGRGPNRDALGAVVKASVAGRTLVRHRASGGSYLSQHDGRLHFGLGERTRVDRLEVTWPDGTRETRQDVPADQVLTIRRGTVSPATQPADRTGRGKPDLPGTAANTASLGRGG